MKNQKSTKPVNSLSTRALLVSVNISQWAARKLDRRATETANLAHKADTGAGNYHKKLLPGAKELEAVSTIASQARKFYYENTLPWMSDGTRIISSKNYLKFQTEMRKIKAEFDQAVKAFSAAYPQLKIDAEKRLGDLYDSSEYPENIEDKFNISVDFLPMPDSKDFRVAVSDAEKREFEKKMKAIETAAMRDAASRLFQVLKAATEKLKDPKAIFRDSLLENIAEISSLIPALNISNDSKLDQLSDDARALVDSIDTDTIRKDNNERDKARKALADIESRMGAFMGGLK
jgi:hypothetical protein